MNGDSGHHAFWADEVADEIESRNPDEPIVIKGAVSPSGIPHIGHFNEIMRGYYVAEVLRERGYEVVQVFTSDDRDGLRKLPRRLADGDWDIVELGEVDAGVLGRNLGVPYTDVPDPFGDGHDSYGGHFTELLRESAKLVGVPVEVKSTTAMYESGEFEAVTRDILQERDRAREILAEYQAGVDDAYVPFMPRCQKCGKLTTGVLSVDLETGTIEYDCAGLRAGDADIDGCGHRGTVTLRDGKLPWRFEWPAGWKVLGVDFEPFGKDHAEGSWPSGKHIARELLDIEPPVPMVYEWFTLDGAALSSSTGNVVTVPDLLRIIEPEVLRYFFVRDPGKQRDLDLSRIDRLVDEFDRFEATYFGEVDAAPRERRFAERAYPLVMEFDEGLPSEALDAENHGSRDGRRAFLDESFSARVRLPYTFAAVLGMTDDTELRVSMARREGHIRSDSPEWAISKAMERVDRARRWAERMDNEYNYRLQAELPVVDIDEATDAALREVADVVANNSDEDEIQGEIYEAAKRHEIPASDLFATGYQLFFGQPEGPRLGPFLAALNRDFVVDRLRREA